MTGTEEWRAVVGYEGIYEVSSLGRVRSLDRLDSTGRPTAGRSIKPVNQGSYVTVHLNFGGSTKRYVHALVAEAFIGPRPDGTEVCHENGHPADNRVENLRYDTHAANNRDTLRHGTHFNAAKVSCIHGHPFDDVNTRTGPRGGRTCRQCERGSVQRYKARKRVSA